MQKKQSAPAGKYIGVFYRLDPITNTKEAVEVILQVSDGKAEVLSTAQPDDTSIVLHRAAQKLGGINL